MGEAKTCNYILCKHSSGRVSELEHSLSYLLASSLATLDAASSVLGV
mgnify:CR=1 FL=1